MSLEVATWVTAIATAVLAVFAVVTAWYARKAFREQAREVAAIEQQVSDQKELTARQTELLKVQTDQLDLQHRQFEREQSDRRRAQASGIYVTVSLRGEGLNEPAPRVAGEPGPVLVVRVENTSRQPVYELVIHWRRSGVSWDQPDVADVLRPQTFVSRTRSFADGLPAIVDRTLYSAVIRFRDAAGVHWLLRPDGQLTEEPAGKYP
jgi:hypothetical protein